MNSTEEDFLRRGGVKATSNRILVARTLLGASAPMSLAELDEAIGTMDRSSIFRVLNLLLEHGLVHGLEDGRGIAKYEPCHGGHDHSHAGGDLHAHFYCEQCQRVICLEDVEVPVGPVPEGFEVRSVNYMVKGLCADCAGRHSGK